MLLPDSMTKPDHFQILMKNIEDTVQIEELLLTPLSIISIKPIAIRLLNSLKNKGSFKSILKEENGDKLIKYIFVVANYIYIHVRHEPSSESIAQKRLFQKLIPIGHELKKIKNDSYIKKIWEESNRFSFIIPEKSFIKNPPDYRYENPSWEYMAMIIADDLIEICKVLSIDTQKILRLKKRSYSSRSQFETDYCLELVSYNKNYFDRPLTQLALDIRNSEVTKSRASFKNSRTIKYIEQVLYRNKKLFNSVKKK